MLQLAHGPAAVRWRRSARARRASLRIDARGACVVVTLPARAARAAGLALLAGHAAWVAGHLAALPPALAFADGALVPLGGEPYRVRHVLEGQGRAWLEAGEIRVAGDLASLRRRVADLLRAEALRRLAALAAAKCALAGLAARRVMVKDTRSRWGSCASDGTLMFCWRVVMAPPLVQDYVVAHEVAHLRHMDHGPRFWALVAELTEHRAAGVAWLAAVGPGLLRAG